jgi:TolA-binding protein
LFEELGVREDVLTALRRDDTLRDDDRNFALEVAQSHQDDPRSLNEAAWNVVKSRLESKAVYARALSQAKAVVRLLPNSGPALNTLGIAQYRDGRYADALTTLTQSAQRNATKQGPRPEDLAFLAMTQHQLGKKGDAKATLDQLHKAMTQPQWAKNADAVDFLREAEALIEGGAHN